MAGLAGSLPSIIGGAAAICSMTSFVPQILQIVKKHDASAVSFRMYVVTVTGFTCWVAYGLMIKSWPVAGSNAVCLVLAAVILILQWRFSNRASRAPTKSAQPAHGPA